MTAEPVSAGVRAVLDAPRGRRFPRPGTPPSSTREQRLLAQMADNPRVAHRQAHGTLPAWMHTHAARLAERDNQPFKEQRRPPPPPQPPPVPPVPPPRPAPDDGPPLPRPRPVRPPLPRRIRRPASHRKPRRLGRAAWRLTGYTLAALAGALAHHLSAGLL
ncbi:hypothetical protein [Nocardiopsis oceani]